MADRPVHWHEGMFMGPQHLQAAQRYDAAQRRKGSRAAVRYNWGIQHLDLNQKALANHRLEILSLTACLRDGTLVDLPEDGTLPVLDLRAALERNPQLMVHLALPRLRAGQANVDEGNSQPKRFLVEMRDIDDENTGMDPQPVRFRLLNVKLLLSDEQEDAYDVLPLARINKSTDADTTPQIDVTYIPPLLGCDAWGPLQVGILRAIYDRIGSKIDLLAEQSRSQGITIDSHASEDTRIVGQLRVLNEAYTVLGVLAFAEGVHPLEPYLELCRLVGQLSIFDPERLRPPELPRYDHDDLGYIYYQVKRYIDGLLDLIIEPDWIARPFQGVGLRMQVGLEPAWLEDAWQMFVAVDSPLSTEQCASLFTERGVLDMKIGSSDRVDTLYDSAKSGLRFTHLPSPRTLPARKGLTYFQIDRKAQPDEWAFVKRSMSLAVRVNQRNVSGDIHGQQAIIIKLQSQQTPVRFTLYVTRQT